MNRHYRHISSIVMLAMVSLAGFLAAAPGKDQAAMSPSEQAVVDELTLARTKPQDYAKFIEAYRKRFKDDGSVDADGQHIRTKEGVKAVDEAIAFLKKAKPLSAVTGSRSLSLAAMDHVKDTGPTGITGHKGTDGSNFSDRIARYCTPRSTSGENISYGPDDARSIVMQLIIDDGVANRGHRANIFNPDFKTAGVAMGSHKVYRNMCVMDFADTVTEKKGAEKKAQEKKTAENKAKK